MKNFASTYQLSTLTSLTRELLVSVIVVVAVVALIIGVGFVGSLV